MKKLKYILFAAFILLFSSSMCYCEISGKKQDSIRKSAGHQTLKSESSLIRKFADYQKKGRITISKTMRKLRKRFDLRTFLWLFIFSLGYGVFHAAGPGHGKAVVVFYLLHCRASIADALKLAGIIVLTHTGLAVILAFLFHTVFTGIKGVAGITFQNNFSFAGGILIIIIGIILVAREIKGRDDKSRAKIAVSKGNMLLMGISAGIVPCPVSLAIMMISLSAGVWYIGFISIVAISLGLAAVLFTAAVLIEKSREGLLKLVAVNSRVSRFVSSSLSYGGLVGIILLGIFISIFYFPILH